MSQNDTPYTYNELSNEDKALLLSHGYLPGELNDDEVRDIVEDLRAQVGGDADSDRLSSDVPADELDGTN